jgi:hypothetical protein
VSDTPGEFGRARPSQRIKAPKEPPKIKTGTAVEICPDDPELRCWAWVQMCLPHARVEVRFRNGGTMIVPRSLIRVP